MTQFTGVTWAVKVARNWEEKSTEHRWISPSLYRRISSGSDNDTVKRGSSDETLSRQLTQKEVHEAY